MAMNKKEQQEMENLRIALANAMALRFTDKVEPDIAPPEYSEGVKNGYAYNCYNREVVKASTAAHGHTYGEWGKINSQRSIPLYSTRLLALRALRNSMENVYAGYLADIDTEIAKNQPQHTRDTV